jgi:uncharacterized lipoprotein YddW (UPF0748 family)
MRAPLALALLFGVAQAPAPATPRAEMRGLWVVRTALVSPAAVDKVVDQAREAGFNALLVQVRGRGDAFYRSRLSPRSPIMQDRDPDFDPLARLLERARRNGLEVHAWLNVLLSAHFGQPLPTGHVVARHPEWLMVPRGGAREAAGADPASLRAIVRNASRADTDVEGYYLSPSAPGVVEHLEDVVGELLQNYPVQGLHLDFIRYPGPEYDWSPAALAGFARQRGRGEDDPLAGPQLDPEGFADYRRGVLTALADRMARAARKERPEVVISAAVVPDEAAAIHHKFQDWPAWLVRGILDAVCPMSYNPDERIFRQQVEVARAYVGSGQRLWAGVGAYRLGVGEVVERVRAARGLGASGVVLFSHESFAAGDLRRLREEAFPAAVAAGGAGAAGRPVRADPR